MNRHERYQQEQKELKYAQEYQENAVDIEALKPIKIFGRELIDDKTIEQLKNCLLPESIGVLTADAHFGYSMPVGGAIAYKNKISISGVGSDIACGNLAVRTDIMANDVDVAKVMDEIFSRIGFGFDRPKNEKVDHSVFDLIDNSPVKAQRKLLDLARVQLGTVGGGNHFVDLFCDEHGYLWIANHFGSRGFGFKTAAGFVNLSLGKNFDDRGSQGDSNKPPVILDLKSELGRDYFKAMTVAGEYAYAGREMVVNKVLEILGNPKITYEVHNHHNFAWMEEHFGEKYCVVRKGCTPAFPGQSGFIGANMHDYSVIVEGVDSQAARDGLFSTVHGAGRKISRTQATGKKQWQKDPKTGKKRPVIIGKGCVDWDQVKLNMKASQIELRGAGADEAPECYKTLLDVLDAQGVAPILTGINPSETHTIRIKHILTPIGVAMAGADTYDEFKD